MIGRLRGIVAYKAPPWLVVDVNGVGYELEAPMSTFYDLPELGREVTLYTHYSQKEDSVSLYGFLREGERRLFRDVQKVSGIGAKIALAVLSGVTVEEFARMVQAGDITALTRIPGIGKKTAERLLLELKGKLGADIGMVAGVARDDTQTDVLNALAALGYSDKEALLAIKSMPAGASVSDGIKFALKALSKA
ncbi:MAG TPA: Holliday junction branch migration protein RuvA [Stenotrophomonas maltophilia]|nr:Holliday junction branch migration protein RuvA [Stenotrophomonas maltophilia]